MKSFLKPVIFFALILPAVVSSGQYKTFDLTEEGDTLNAVTLDGLRHGKWVISVPALRGEPGYEEEGLFVKGQKNGYWRQYSIQGDLIGVEHYKYGGKDGLQQYFSELGGLVREENWRGYNPDAPYDTIPVYGEGSNEILNFKIVKAEPYSVKDGVWKYFDPGSGRVIRSETWDRNNLISQPEKRLGAYVKPKNVEKTEEMLKWEKENSGKKRAYRDGSVGF